MTRTARLALLLVLAAPLEAQEPRVPAFAALEGVVLDSLRGGAAKGALVVVGDTKRFAFADSLGRFRIDSIPPGEHQVEMSHEMLDTLGVRVLTLPLTFATDSTVFLTLAVPAPRTVMRAKCPAAPDSGALFGAVLSADSEAPVSAAEVRLWWIELTVGEKIGVRYEPQRRSATTDASGRYKFCGLPTELIANISAARGSDSTTTLPLAYGEPGLGLAMLFLPISDSSGAGASQGGATVRGVVLDSAGAPLAGARVGLGASLDAAVTDSIGAFVLSGQRSGTQSLIVRKLGYQPAEVILNLSRRQPREVTVRLEASVPVLEAVYVEARRNAGLQRVGFTDRQRTGLGRYLTQSDLEKRHAIVVSDFLRHLPPARESGMSNTSCTQFWVDGNRWHGDADDFVAPSEVAAIEVYGGTYAPVEFQSFDGGCRVVVIWTKWKLGVR